MKCSHHKSQNNGVVYLMADVSTNTMASPTTPSLPITTTIRIWIHMICHLEFYTGSKRQAMMPSYTLPILPMVFFISSLGVCFSPQHGNMLAIDTQKFIHGTSKPTKSNTNPLYGSALFAKSLILIRHSKLQQHAVEAIEMLGVLALALAESLPCGKCGGITSNHERSCEVWDC